MPDHKFSLRIVTSDKMLMHDLYKEKIPGIRVSQECSFCDSLDLEPVITKTLTFIVDGSINVELALLTNWLYERFIKQQPDKASINGTEVSKNPEQITIVVNNYIQASQYNMNKNSDK